MHVAVPEIHLHVAVPEIHLHVAIPEIHLHVAVPEIHLNVAVPEIHLHVAVPEIHLRVAVPEIHLHVAVPEIHLHVAVPEIHLRVDGTYANQQTPTTVCLSVFLSTCPPFVLSLLSSYLFGLFVCLFVFLFISNQQPQLRRISTRPSGHSLFLFTRSV